MPTEYSNLKNWVKEKYTGERSQETGDRIIH